MISVIMPVYKAEKYLDRSVTSVLNQTYKDFELLLINDGSPDNSGSLCDEWAKKDSRIKAFHKTNGGTSDARNFGIEKAQGDYITFIDCDDYVLPNWLYDMYSTAKETDADIVKGGIYYVPEADVSENNAVLCYETEPLRTVQFARETITSHEFHIRLLTRIGYDAVWNQLVKADIHKKCKFPSGHMHEDYYIFFDLFKHTNTIEVTDSIGYCWGQRTESQSMNIHNSFMADIIDNYLSQHEELKYRYNDKKYSDLALLKAMERFFYYLAGTPKINTVTAEFLTPLWTRMKKICKSCNIKDFAPSGLQLQYKLCCISLPLYMATVRIKARFTK